MEKLCIAVMKQDLLLIKDFNYDLPDEQIAKHPLPCRHDSQLMIYREGEIKVSQYKCLAEYLPSNTLLVFNNTKVVEVRLLFTKETGSVIEVFCLEPAGDYKDITTAMLQHGSVRWKCLVGGAKKWKEEVLTSTRDYDKKEVKITARKLVKEAENFLVEFKWNDETLSFAEVLHLFGNVPLPPYLKRAAEEEDKERYQTIYAKQDGSVAAPTAGLHFTDEVFAGLKKKEIETVYLTLHVGAGTFQPVKTEAVSDHQMHTEFIEVSIDLIERLIHTSTQKIVAVGTTSLRTLESLYWLGVKAIYEGNIDLEELFLSQWEAYELPQGISASEALQALYNCMRKQQQTKLIARTSILIAPGYKLRMAEGLITNFHQPQSTLLLLVAALIDEDWKRVYQYALDNEFRFLSYGDGSLLWKKN